jgi:hypothetical protein
LVDKATFGDLAVNWPVALRKTDSGVKGRSASAADFAPEGIR